MEIHVQSWIYKPEVSGRSFDWRFVFSTQMVFKTMSLDKGRSLGELRVDDEGLSLGTLLRE